MTAPKEVPWIVALIAATLAWTLTHIVDRLTSAPLISYELEQLRTVNGPDGKPLVSGSFVVRNLTRETPFNNAHFQIYAGSTSDAQGSIEAVEGSFVFPGENFQPRIDEVREGGEFVLTYDLPEMQPHQAWRLIFSGLQVPSPTLSLRMSSPPQAVEPPPPPSIVDTSPTPSVSPKSSRIHVSPTPAASPINQQETPKTSEALHGVQLVEANWQTYLVDHEIVILAILACCFSVILVVSLFLLRVPEPATMAVSNEPPTKPPVVDTAPAPVPGVTPPPASPVTSKE